MLLYCNYITIFCDKVIEEREGEREVAKVEKKSRREAEMRTNE